MNQTTLELLPHLLKNSFLFTTPPRGQQTCHIHQHFSATVGGTTRGSFTVDWPVAHDRAQQAGWKDELGWSGNWLWNWGSERPNYLATGDGIAAGTRRLPGPWASWECRGIKLWIRRSSSVALGQKDSHSEPSHVHDHTHEGRKPRTAAAQALS